MVDSHNAPAEIPLQVERRRAVRICCTGFAEGISTEPPQLFRGEIRNISETGCLLAVRAKLALLPGAFIDLRFKLNGSHYRTLARVVEAVTSKCIRMQFVAQDPALSSFIRRVLNPDASPRK